MVTMHVHEMLDDEENEVVLELSSGGMILYAYCYPFLGFSDTQKITLYALFANNISRCGEWHPAQRLPNSYFGQHLCAEIVSIKERTVRVGEISIILDSSIDGDYPVGSLISFDVQRLDY